MANKNLFNTRTGRGPSADTTNKAGGRAHSFDSKHALAQLVATGCLGDTFYASAKEQLDEILQLADGCDPEFVAKVAVYGRKRAHMKDTPALLAAWLFANGHSALLKPVFGRVVDNARMLRNFVQIVRSGRLGRKSLGSAGKRLVQDWLASRTDEQLFRASVGNDPSLADIIKMAHPRPANKAREALYAYLIGKPHREEDLPAVVREYEGFKRNGGDTPPNVEFRMLTSLALNDGHWKQIARDARWQMTRMNLNTFARHNVFSEKEMVDLISRRLSDTEEVRKSRCFPYQLFTAYKNAAVEVPVEVKNALQDALEVATNNIPEYPGKVWIFPDVSGSMGSPATGHRYRATTTVTCRDVAALFSAAVLRRNPTAEVLPFADKLFSNIRLNGRDTVVTNAERMSRLPLPGGGTNCSLPLRELNRQKKRGDLLIYVSDNQSWMDSMGWNNSYGLWGQRVVSSSTSAQSEWEAFRKRNPGAKMVCIDIQPYKDSQLKESKGSVLNVGGFSDAVFDVIANFAKHGDEAPRWVEEIERGVDLEG